MHVEEALCVCQCGFEIDGRDIWLVSIKEGKLGIMVIEANDATVYPINPVLPGISELNASRIIFGSMGLLAAVKTWNYETLSDCFETALVMTIVESEKEQREMLSCIYDEEMVEEILTTSWTLAVKLATQVFSHTDRELVTNLYIFSYCDPPITKH